MSGNLFDDDFDFDLGSEDETGGNIGESGTDNNKDYDEPSNFDLGLGDEFDTTESDQDLEYNKKGILKTALIAVGCAVLLIVVVFTTVNIINNVRNKKDNPDKPSETPTTQGDYTKPDVDTKPVETVQPNAESPVGWKEFASADGLSMKKELVDTIFTVTSTKHYLKVVDSENNIQLKTVLVGALAGYIGTYEIEVPYSKGSLLKLGDSFTVSVEIGTTSDGKSVIGEVRY